MTNDTTRQHVMFTGLSKKPVTVDFDQEHASSDGGALLLKACDERLGLSAALADCLRDSRQPGKVQHSLRELLRQRLFAIACGYPDGNDAARLNEDPVFKLLADRDPVAGASLASQPTLSRFEHSADSKDLLRLSEALMDCVIERHRKRLRRVKRITIDLDPTVDPTHGKQQLSLFNRSYGTWCYLPMAGFLSFDNEVDQYLFSYILRDGHAHATRGCVGLLKRLVPRLKKAFPKARLRIRLDAGFSGPSIYEFFEAQGMEYVVCMAKNNVLHELAEPLMVPVREAFAHGERLAVFGEARYQARSWDKARRVIIKAQITHHPGRSSKDNARFIITNVRGWPQHIYERIYCARGDAENRIKELKDGLDIDRTSCTAFHANQLRVLLTAASYVLMQELRLKARHTSCARAQVSTLRLRLLKIGVWVESSVRRIVFHLPTSTVYADDWRRIARSVGAIAT